MSDDDDVARAWVLPNNTRNGWKELLMRPNLVAVIREGTGGDKLVVRKKLNPGLFRTTNVVSQQATAVGHARAIKGN